MSANGPTRRGALLCLALLASLAPPAHAQRSEGPRVRAHLSSGVVRLGGQVTLVVTVEEAENATLGPLPEVEGLRLGPAGEPRVSRTQSFINGRYSRSVERSWLIAVQPLRAGDFTIPPIPLTVAGEERWSAALALTVVEDLRGADLGLLEIRPSSTAVVEGQPFSVELRFGWDMGLAERVNYANLSLPWWGQLPGLVELEPPPPTPGGREVEVRLNSTETLRVEEVGREDVRGRPFRTFRAVRSFVPTRTGQLELPTSFLEFGHVVERRDIFLTRGTEKVESWFVRAEGVAIDVVPLPEQGRPLDYGGAIGTLEAQAEARPRDVDVGESIKLTVEWTGAGNLQFFTAPDPARLETYRGFRVYGTTERRSFDRRTVTYDLAPITSEVDEIPPLPLPVYDPELGLYRTVFTRPIPIHVRPLEGASGLASVERAEGFERDIADIVADARSRGRQPGPGPGAIGALAAATPLLWLFLRALARRRADPDSPLERRRRRARRALARDLERASGPKEELDALFAFLAARTREAPQAWLGRDVSELARSGGLDPEVAAELGELIVELERAAYGGGPAQPRRERILWTAGRLVRGGL